MSHLIEPSGTHASVWDAPHTERWHAPVIEGRDGGRVIPDGSMR